MDIQLKKKDENDSEFLLRLMGEIKTAELNAYDWPEQMKNQLMLMQYNGYEQMIMNEYPNADDFVIMFNSEKAGRLQLDNNDNSMRIINISLLPAFQNKGIGSLILKNIIEDGKLLNKPVHLNVDKNNPAVNLYLRLNFKVTRHDDLTYGMTYDPIQKK